MADILGISWLSTNSLRNYPLSQSATCFSQEGNWKLPDDFLVDLKLAVPFIMMTGVDVIRPYSAYFYLSGIQVFPQGFIISISYMDGLNEVLVATSAPVSFTSFTANSTVVLRGVTESNTTTTTTYKDFGPSYGIAVLGKVDSLIGMSGNIKFDLAGGRLESSVVAFGPRRISGLKVYDDAQVSNLVYGQVALISGANHRIDSSGSPTTGFSLVFSARDVTDFSAECGCPDIILGDCIRTINNVPPGGGGGGGGGGNGNIDITGGDCISISPGPTSITIADQCSKPCCGCGELQYITQDITALNASISSMRTNLSTLSGHVSILREVCLATTANPTSCAAVAPLFEFPPTGTP